MRAALAAIALLVAFCALFVVVSIRFMAASCCVQVADFLDRAVKISLRIQATSGKLLKDFTAAASVDAEALELKAEIAAFASAFPMPGKPASA
jgi:hypothetical protein